MEILKNDFLSKLGGMYMVDYPDIPDWSDYEGYKNNLVFSIIQTISHTQIIMYSDLSLLFLRFSQIVSNASNTDAVNYYLGQYYSNNFGDYESCFRKINKSNPLYLFGQLKIAEKHNDIKKIQKLANKNPLFIPAFLDTVRQNIKNGHRHAALHLVNRALKQPNLPVAGRIYFLKHRAHINLMFNKPNKAQIDINKIKKLDDSTPPDLMLLQARVWEQQNTNLDTAYEHAMSLIKLDKSDATAWDLLGLIINKREGIDNALEIMERVGEVTVTISAIYEHLGDLYTLKGDTARAKRAYTQALDLSDDCMIVVPFVQRKIRNLK